MKSKDKKSLLSAINRINNNEYYADDELDFLIKENVSNDCTTLPTSLSVVDLSKDNEIESSNFREALREFAAGQNTQLVAPISVNKSLHFAGLHIKRNEDDSFTATYVDPLGAGLKPAFKLANTTILKDPAETKGLFGFINQVTQYLGLSESEDAENFRISLKNPLPHSSIPFHIINALELELGIAPQDINLTTTKIQHPTNSHCGAFTTEILTSLANNFLSVSEGRLTISEDKKQISDLDQEASDYVGKTFRQNQAQVLGEFLSLPKQPKEYSSTTKQQTSKPSKVSPVNIGSGGVNTKIGLGLLLFSTLPSLTTAQNIGRSKPPTSSPSFSPSLPPSLFPSLFPTTIAPSYYPSVIPSISPSLKPTSSASTSSNPTSIPTKEFPSANTSKSPTFTPSSNAPNSLRPTFRQTTLFPTINSTNTTFPTFTPSQKPSTQIPSRSPTRIPSFRPSFTDTPTGNPTDNPTDNPTSNPSQNPSPTPTFQPTYLPTILESEEPTINPTSSPSNSPTEIPTTSNPTSNPSQVPSMDGDNMPTGIPSQKPSSFKPSLSTITEQPSQDPTFSPTFTPSTLFPTFKSTDDKSPTSQPSELTKTPTTTPSYKPSTLIPSRSPTRIPSFRPSFPPTDTPTGNPTDNPTSKPTSNPSQNPSQTPTFQPTYLPTIPESKEPTINPTSSPSNSPTEIPTTSNPTSNPSQVPSMDGDNMPTGIPSQKPSSFKPSLSTITEQPSQDPTDNSTNNPTSNPSQNPLQTPTYLPTINEDDDGVINDDKTGDDLINDDDLTNGNNTITIKSTNSTLETTVIAVEGVSITAATVVGILTRLSSETWRKVPVKFISETLSAALLEVGASNSASVNIFSNLVANSLVYGGFVAVETYATSSLYKKERNREKDGDNSNENVISDRKLVEGSTEIDEKGELSETEKALLISAICEAILHALTTAAWAGKPKKDHDIVPFLTLTLCGAELDKTSENMLLQFSGQKANSREGEWFQKLKNAYYQHLITDGFESVDLTKFADSLDRALRSLATESSLRAASRDTRHRIKSNFFNKSYREGKLNSTKDSLRKDLAELGQILIPNLDLSSDAENQNQIPYQEIQTKIYKVLNTHHSIHSSISEILNSKYSKDAATDFSQKVEKLKSLQSTSELNSRSIDFILPKLEEEGTKSFDKKGQLLNDDVIELLKGINSPLPTISLYKKSIEGKLLDECSGILERKKNNTFNKPDPDNSFYLNIEEDKFENLNFTPATLRKKPTNKTTNKPKDNLDKVVELRNFKGSLDAIHPYSGDGDNSKEDEKRPLEETRKKPGYKVAQYSNGIPLETKTRKDKNKGKVGIDKPAQQDYEEKDYEEKDDSSDVDLVSSRESSSIKNNIVRNKNLFPQSPISYDSSEINITFDDSSKQKENSERTITATPRNINKNDGKVLSTTPRDINLSAEIKSLSKPPRIPTPNSVDFLTPNKQNLPIIEAQESTLTTPNFSENQTYKRSTVDRGEIKNTITLYLPYEKNTESNKFVFCENSSVSIAKPNHPILQINRGTGNIEVYDTYEKILNSKYKNFLPQESEKSLEINDGLEFYEEDNKKNVILVEEETSKENVINLRKTFYSYEANPDKYFLIEEEHLHVKNKELTRLIKTPNKPTTLTPQRISKSKSTDNIYTRLNTSSDSMIYSRDDISSTYTPIVEKNTEKDHFILLQEITKETDGRLVVENSTLLPRGGSTPLSSEETELIIKGSTPIKPIGSEAKQLKFTPLTKGKGN